MHKAKEEESSEWKIQFQPNSIPPFHSAINLINYFPKHFSNFMPHPDESSPHTEISDFNKKK